MLTTRLVKLILVTISLISLTGCFAWKSAPNPNPLPAQTKKHTNPGTMYVVTGEQRAIYAKDFGTLCAEPSPDALSSLSRSLGLSGSDASNKLSIGVAASLATSVASIGLRTQSIQLMRDSLYRLCEAYYGRALNQTMMKELMQRYQDHMVAILAIEQLTGAVRAQQVGLSGTANANTLATLANVKDMLEAAITDLTRKSESLTKLTIEHEKATAKSKENSDQKVQLEEELSTAVEEQKAHEEETDEYKEYQGKIETLTERIAKNEVAQGPLDSTAKELEIRKIAAEEMLKVAKSTKEAIEKNHDAAMTNAVSSASSQVVFGNTSSTSVDMDKIADSVEKIVTTAIKQPRLSEQCFKLLNSSANQLTSDLRKVCTAILAGLSTSDTKSYLGIPSTAEE